MAFLAVHAHVQPSEFDAMTPADSELLAREVEDLVDADFQIRLSLAKLIATACGARFPL